MTIATNARIALGVFIISMLGIAPDAGAQGAELPWFVMVGGGAQPKQRDLAATQTLTIYSETATITSAVPIKNGAIFEIGGGRKIWGNLGVGVGFSTFFPRKADGAIEASIPDPFFFNRPRIVRQTLPEPEHKENGVHLQAIWFQPITSRFEIALSAGPSIIKVSQELAGQATIPLGTQNVNVAKATEEGTANGYNAGLDAIFVITRNIGVGVFARVAQGKVDLPSAQDLEVGGVQAGIRGHIRF